MKRELVWRKSSHSGSDGGECVELTRMKNKIALRDSKDPNGPVLVMSRAALREAIRAAAE